MSVDPNAILAQLTTEEKISLLSGRDVWRTASIERLDVGSVKVTDGPVGARGDSTTGTTSICLPATIGLAATFDPTQAARFGQLLGRETVRKGSQVLLAPTVNLARHPLGGRNFESFGEDPLLTAELSLAYVHGVQAEGVAACAKHFVANDVEHSRMTISSEVTEPVLREVYLAPFEALVEGGVLTIMASYPKLNGQFCTEHHWLLTTVLRQEWGFDGLVMSDWGATHHRSRPLQAGLDLEMPGPAQAFGSALAEALDAGEVDEGLLDTRVGAVLDLAARTGRLGTTEPDTEISVDDPEERAQVRHLAADAMVLLSNDGLLPLGPAHDAPASIAVIGPNAEVGVEQGGGSAQVPAHRVVSPLDGLTQAFPHTEITHQPGCLAHRYLPPVPPEAWLDAAGRSTLTLDQFDRDPTAGTTNDAADATGGDPADAFEGEPARSRPATSIGAFVHDDGRHRAPLQRWTGRLPIETSGRHRFGVLAVGRSRVLVDGVLVADNWTDPQPGDAFFQWGTAEVVGEIELTAGAEAEVVVEWARGTSAPLSGLRFGHLPPIDEDDLLARAVAAAGEADVAVVVAGLNREWETEGHDRLGFALPGRQNELIEAVAAANPRTVVVINAGSPVEAPWFDRVAATLMTWYPGQELGLALADVLSGAQEPGGRLPLTWPRALADAPFALPEPTPGPPIPGATLAYTEGLDIGYRSYDRRGVDPLAPFGFGLGYTTFTLGPPILGPAGDPTPGQGQAPGDVTVRVPVTNTGDRAGKVVVQAYLEWPPGHDDRPLRQLAGFAADRLEPGATAEVGLTIAARRFQRWDEATGRWVDGVGSFRLSVGTSSRHREHTVEVERGQLRWEGP